MIIAARQAVFRAPPRLERLEPWNRWNRITPINVLNVAQRLNGLNYLNEFTSGTFEPLNLEHLNGPFLKAINATAGSSDRRFACKVLRS